MAIIRAPRPQSGFYILDKRISEDRRLSWASRGVLVFLLGKPDHWRVSVQNLINETERAVPHSGRDAVYRMLKELETVGYITRQQGKAEGGLFGEMDYLVSECSNIEPLTENPDAVGISPLTALPLTVEPLTANPTLVSTEKAVSNKKAAKTENAEHRFPSGSRSKKLELSLKSFIEHCKAMGEDSIPESDAIFVWADKTDVPFEMVKVCWCVFKDRYLDADQKKQGDWRAHFRNAVKRNWYRLWFFDANRDCRLTTAGEQARREHGIDLQAQRSYSPTAKFDPVAYVNRNRRDESRMAAAASIGLGNHSHSRPMWRDSPSDVVTIDHGEVINADASL